MSQRILEFRHWEHVIFCGPCFPDGINLPRYGVAFRFPMVSCSIQVIMIHGRRYSPNIINPVYRQKGRNEAPNLHLCLHTITDKLYKSCSLEL